MTNRALLRVPEQVLGKLDRQRLFLLLVEGTPIRCPACKTPVNVFDAAGIDLDAYDFGATPYAYCCPGCGAALTQVLPLFPGLHSWHWELKGEWLQEQLRKAKAFDAQCQSSEDTRPT